MVLDIVVLKKSLKIENRKESEKKFHVKHFSRCGLALESAFGFSTKIFFGNSLFYKAAINAFARKGLSL
jgi:hypothetical protein